MSLLLAYRAADAGGVRLPAQGLLPVLGPLQGQVCMGLEHDRSLSVWWC